LKLKQEEKMFKTLEGSGNGVVAVELIDSYTKEDVEELKKLFEDELSKSNGKLNVLFKVDELKLHKITPAAFIDDCRYSLGHIKQLEHLAIVGHSELEKLLIEADNRIFGRPEDDLIEKYFDVSDIDQAWKFVEK
jgi:hypothetical protein